MTQQLLHRTSPRKETLEFLKNFARLYQPGKETEARQLAFLFANPSAAMC